MIVHGHTWTEDGPQILEHRLRYRGEDSDEVIERRLADAAREIRNYCLYDYVLINEDIDESKIKATLRNGILELDLPKKEKARPRQIEVHAP